MPSEFDTFAASFAAPALAEQFAERDEHGKLAQVPYKPNKDSQANLLVGVTVGPLRQDVREDNFGNVSSLETAWLDIPREQLAGMELPLPEKGRFQVDKYPGAWFLVDDTDSDYGGVLVRIGLKRVPLVERGQQRKERSG